MKQLAHAVPADAAQPRNLVIAAGLGLGLALVIGLSVISLAGAAQAQVRGQTPPADGMPLPALLAEVQARENVAWFDEVNWDDDGYWEIEFGRQGGGKVEIRVDPITGDTLTR